jgi:HAMP domain-containing protein
MTLKKNKIMKINFTINIRTKLLLMTLISIIPLIIMGVTVYIKNKSMEKKIRNVSTLILPGIMNVNNILHHLDRFRIIEYKYCLSDDAKEKSLYEKEMQFCINQINWNMKGVPSLMKKDYETSLLIKFRTDYHAYIGIHKKILIYSAYGRYDSVRLLLTTKSRALFTSQITDLQQLSGLLKITLRYQSDQIHSEILTINFVFATIIPALILLLVFLYYKLSVSIFQPLSRIAKAASRLATEQRCLPIPVISNDEIGSLTQTFNEMSRNLTNAFHELYRLNNSETR